MADNYTNKLPHKKNESRTVALLKGTVTVAIYEITMLLSGFIVPRVMLEFYGSATNGMVSSITQLLNYVILIEAGLTASLVFSLYRPLASDDIDTVNGIFSAGWKYYNKIGFLCYGIIALLAVIYPYFIDDIPGLSKLEIVAIVLVMGLPSALNFWVLGKYNIIITADKKTYVYTIARSVSTIMYMLVIVFAAYVGVSILWARVIGLIATFVQIWMVVSYVKKQYPYLNHGATPITSALSLRGDAFAQEIASTVQLGAPQVILTFISGNMLLVSVYSVFNIVINGITSLVSLFGSGLTAILGDLIVSDDKRGLNRAFEAYETLISTVSSVLFSVSFLMIMPFVRLYTNGIEDISYDMPILGFLAVLNCLIYSIQLPERTLVRAAGLYKETRYRALLQTAICVVLGVVLCFKFDVYGVLIGLLASNIYRAVDLLMFAHKYVTKVSPWKSLRKWILIFIICVPFVIVSFTFDLHIDSYMQWLLIAVISTIVSILITSMLFFIFERNSVSDVLLRIKNLIRK